MDFRDLLELVSPGQKPVMALYVARRSARSTHDFTVVLA
jgi:hypothetical protein